jgi:hypothetical protein
VAWRDRAVDGEAVSLLTASHSSNRDHLVMVLLSGHTRVMDVGDHLAPEALDDRSINPRPDQRRPLRLGPSPLRLPRREGQPLRLEANRRVVQDRVTKWGDCDVRRGVETAIQCGSRFRWCLTPALTPAAARPSGGIQPVAETRRRCPKDAVHLLRCVRRRRATASGPTAAGPWRSVKQPAARVDDFTGEWVEPTLGFEPRTCCLRIERRSKYLGLTGDPYRDP